MTYARGREILDADSHVMELPDFLDEFIEPELAGRLRRRALAAVAPLVDKAVAQADARRSDANEAAIAEERLLTDKGWLAMGAFDSQERSHALDLLGFQRQLVFATFATAMFVGSDVAVSLAPDTPVPRLPNGTLVQRISSVTARSAEPPL